MVIDMSQDSSRPFVPRPEPRSIPSTNWNDAPTWCLQVNDQWGAHILGVLEALGQRDTWLGTEAEVDAALDNVSQLIESFVTAVCSEGIVEPFIVGEIRLFAYSPPPDGWIHCQGNELSRATYADLFARIGTIYGAGDGSTTFLIPDYRRKFLAGFEPAPGGDFDLNHTGGEETHALTIAEMPAHSHTGVVSANNPLANRAVVSSGGAQNVRPAGTSDNTGSGTPHENRPPWGVVVPAIYTGVL